VSKAEAAVEKKMSDFKIETPDERRERYLRLAKAAADAAAKTPMAAPREIYLKLAHSWAAMAENHEQIEEASAQIDAVVPPSTSLNAKLNHGG
jgi:hypothetical protein